MFHIFHTSFLKKGFWTWKRNLQYWNQQINSIIITSGIQNSDNVFQKIIFFVSVFSSSYVFFKTPFEFYFYYIYIDIIAFFLSKVWRPKVFIANFGIAFNSGIILYFSGGKSPIYFFKGIWRSFHYLSFFLRLDSAF